MSGWEEQDVLSMLRRYNDMPEIDEIVKLGDANAVELVIDKVRYAVVGVDPKDLPTQAAREIRRRFLWG